MPIYHNENLVDIPDEKGIKISVAGAKRERYVYKKIKYFRNEEGKTRTKKLLIGKLDEHTGKMSPNRSYFEYYNLPPFLVEGQVLSYGFIHLIQKISEEIGLLKCIEQNFGEKRAKELLAIAAFIIQEGNVMDNIDDWQSRTFLPKLDISLTSQSTSRVFKEISDVERNGFFKSWIKKIFSGGTVCYDVTSISSYSEDIPGIEYGYNRDGDLLPQLNLGAFCDENSKMPLYYSLYNGSLTDRTNLSYVLNDANKRGLKNVKLILDGGFWKSDCFKWLDDVSEAFTVGMDSHLKLSRSIVLNHGYEIESSKNKIQADHTFCIRIPQKIYKISGNVLLYFNSSDYADQVQELFDKLERLETQLKNLKRYPNQQKRKNYEKYFRITKNENNSGFTFSRDNEKVNSLMKLKGYFLLFSTDAESTNDELLFYYRSKDIAEKLFEQIKDYMDGDRIKTHTEKTTEGKIFVTFLATILRTYLAVKISPFLSEYSTSVKQGIKQLCNVKVILNSDEIYLSKALTKKQREIFELFNCEEINFQEK
jgi:transposase